MRTTLYIALLTIGALYIALQMQAQGTITELHFPYYKGYTFKLEGKKVKYDRYNFPSASIPEWTHYDIDFSEQDGKTLRTNFAVTYLNDDGTPNGPHNSALMINKKGMSWAPVNGKGPNTQAIRLPLKTGSHWQAWFGQRKYTMTCITTDTIIETYKGKVHAFGIRYSRLSQSTDEYDVYVTIEEFYVQYWGKIRWHEVCWAVMKDTGKELRLYDRTTTIAESNLSEEWEKQIPFVQE